MKEEFITLKELKSLLHIKSTNTIKKYMSKGMPYIKLGDRKLLFNKDKVIAWFGEQNNEIH